MADGNAYIIGGNTQNSNSAHNLCSVYNFKKKAFASCPNAPYQADSMAVTVVDDTRLLIAGGKTSSSTDTRKASILDVKSGEWNDAGSNGKLPTSQGMACALHAVMPLLRERCA